MPRRWNSQSAERAHSGPLRCRLLCDLSSAGLSQIFSGFAILAGCGILDVSVHPVVPRDLRLGGVALGAVIGDRRLIYDVRDQPHVNHQALAWSDHYFKRSFSNDADDARTAKIHPLGLNYAVYTARDWRFRRMYATAFRHMTHPITIGRTVVDLSSVLSRLARRTAGRSNCALEAFEAAPAIRDRPRVLLLTRTWDPMIVRDDEPLATTWRAINDMRADCVRALRREFGTRATAALAPTPDAIRDYPDCVAASLVGKRLYLSLMKEFDICVATKGLSFSNGWRLGEYVAGSRAIVTEPLEFEVTGGFESSTHYDPFTEADQCVERVHGLMADPDRRLGMMQANRGYYEAHLRPDALVLDSLRTAGVLGTP